MNKELLADAYYQYILSALLAGKKQDAVAKYQEMGRLLDSHSKYYSLKNLIAPVQSDTDTSGFFALVIGIDRYEKPDWYMPLQGCVNDANLFVELISSVRKNPHIIFLQNEDATYQQIVNAFEDLYQKTKPKDTVAVYFSGHAYIKGQNSPEYSLVTFDSNNIAVKDEKPVVLWGSELHEAMQKIKAINKFLVIDTHSDRDFLDRVEVSGNYTMMFGCDVGEQAYEQQFDGKTHGVFTYALAAVIREYKAEGDGLYNLYEQVVKYIKDRNFIQTPKMVGDITPLFFPQKELNPIDLINIISNNRSQLSERNYYQLSYFLQKAPLIQSVYFPIFKKVGLHLRQKGEWDKAAIALESYFYKAENKDDELDALIPLVEIFDRLGQYDKASHFIREWMSSHPDMDEKHPLIDLYHKYNRQNTSSQAKYALVVGISNYKSSKITPLKSAKKDAENWYRYLTEDLKLPKENVALLTDENATRKSIFSEFEKYAALAKDNPVLFCYAGYGAAYQPAESVTTRAIYDMAPVVEDNDTPIIPAILSYESRHGKNPDIFFKDLHDICLKNESRFLTCLIDAGFDDQPGDRGMAVKVINTKGILKPVERYRTADALTQGIGNLTLLSAAANTRNLSEKNKLINVETSDHGVFSQVLLDLFRTDLKAAYTFHQLAKALQKKKQLMLPNYTLSPRAIGDPDAVFFGAYKIGDQEIAQIRAMPIANLKTLLEQQIGSNWGDFPDNPVLLALTEALLGNIEKAAAMLSAAMADETKEDQRQVKANYHLGRILVENSSQDDKEDWSQALNALRATIQVMPGFAPAYYYLGKAIRQVSIIEGRSEAVKAFQTYQQSNYPIGHQEEVDKYLDSLDDERLRNRYMQDGMKHLEKNELTEAEKCFQEARLLGENAAFYYMAEVYNLQNDFLRALNSYNQAKILGVLNEDLGYKMADMVRNFLLNSNTIQDILDDLQAYNDNPSILKYSDTATLLEHLHKIQEHLGKLEIR